MKKKKLGEVLRERGYISSADLSRAIEEQKGKVVRLGELLLEREVVSRPELIQALVEVTRVPYVDCSTVLPTAEALKAVPRGVAERCSALPVVFEGTRLVVVMAEPQNLQLIDELRFTSGSDIAVRLGFHKDICLAIKKAYTGGEEPEVIEPETPAGPAETADSLSFVSTSSRQRNQEAMEEIQAELTQQKTPAVRMVSKMILAAMERQASDIHIEPQAGETIVRFRVDGMLRDFERIPRQLQNSMVSRIKIISDMDIAERRVPQDGRFLVKLGHRSLDLRVSTLPTQYGEKVVMRLLESNAPMRTFEQLGFSPEIADGLIRALALPQGMLLVTGPTGSGKSTTLYSALNILRKPSVNIVTIEDPIEYVLAGINQVQVNTKAGLNFAGVLRSILRQDPNVIMVGEIRDRETAEIALKAAQTGHLVLSTLHTNDSVSAVVRLLDLGVAGFLVASSVTAILAQRLVRRLCECNELGAATPEFTSQMMEWGVSDPPRTQRSAVGCNACDHTGYRGRVGVYEIISFDESVKNVVRTTGRSDEIRNLARHAGMKQMQEYAVEKVKQGVTSMEEVLRVVPFEPLPMVGCQSCGHDLMPAFSYCPYCGSKREDAESSGEAQPRLVKQGAR
jgi:type IV pilus assembly protein PilB